MNGRIEGGVGTGQGDDTLGAAADQSRTGYEESDHGPDELQGRRARLVADGGGLENRYGW
jgi:hypothetical protein